MVRCYDGVVGGDDRAPGCSREAVAGVVALQLRVSVGWTRQKLEWASCRLMALGVVLNSLGELVRQ